MPITANSRRNVASSCAVPTRIAPCRSRSSRARSSLRCSRAASAGSACRVCALTSATRVIRSPYSGTSARYMSDMACANRLRIWSGETNTVSRMGQSWQCRPLPTLPHSRRPCRLAASCTAASASRVGWQTAVLPGAVRRYSRAMLRSVASLRRAAVIGNSIAAPVAPAPSRCRATATALQPGLHRCFGCLAGLARRFQALGMVTQLAAQQRVQRDRPLPAVVAGHDRVAQRTQVRRVWRHR